MPGLGFLIKPVLWFLASVVGWEFLTRKTADPETGEERIGKAAIWAVAAVAAVFVVVKVMKRGVV